MGAAAFIAVKRVDSHHLRHDKEVFQTQSLFKFGVEVVGAAYYTQVGVELLAHILKLVERFYKALESTAHANKVPHHMTETLVDFIGTLGTLDSHKFLDTVAYCLFSVVKLFGVGCEVGHLDLVAEVVLHSVRKHEVTVGKTLHESRRAETVCAVVGEVTFTDGKQTLDRCLEFVVDPDTAHGVVAGGEYHHRGLIGVVIGNHLVHVEEVAVAVAHNIGAETLYGIFEVEIYRISCTYAEAGIAAFFCGTAGYVTGAEVAECGITALQIEVTVFVGDVCGAFLACTDSLGVLFFLGHPDTAVVTERFAHECELRLVFAVNGDTGGVNLSECEV